MKKLTKDLPISSISIVPFPSHFNLVNLLKAACSFSSLPIVLDLWKYILETGVNPCWDKACFNELATLLCNICYPVYQQIAPFPITALSVSKIASIFGGLCKM